jgi:homoserine kinase
VSWAQSPAVVRVPATSANLGPGFDAFGLALAMYDQVEARVTGGGLAVTVRGEGEETATAGERHLVVRAMRAAFGAMGGQPDGIALRCTNVIPHGRGLGSSAAAVVAGILAARALVADGADRLPGAGVLRLAVELEGHPDNVAACLAGGLTVAWRPQMAGAGAAGAGMAGAGMAGAGMAGNGVAGAAGAGAGLVPGADVVPANGGQADDGPAGGEPAGGPVRLLRLDVLGAVTAVVCVAPIAMATHEARLALPASVPHADAAANAARSALLLAALTSDPAVLFDATEDYLHQRYRSAAMPQTADLLARLRRAGVAAVVSGSGPSILALGLAGEQPGLAVVDSIARETGIAWRVTPLKVDRQGATVQPGGNGVLRPGAARQGQSTNQAPEPGVLPAGGSTQGRVANPATHRPQSRECRGLLWC